MSNSYLTAVANRKGPQLQLNWMIGTGYTPPLHTPYVFVKLNTITDAAGKVTTLNYSPTDTDYPDRIVSIKRPLQPHRFLWL